MEAAPQPIENTTIRKTKPSIADARLYLLSNRFEKVAFVAGSP